MAYTTVLSLTGITQWTHQPQVQLHLKTQHNQHRLATKFEISIKKWKCPLLTEISVKYWVKLTKVPKSWEHSLGNTDNKINKKNWKNAMSQFSSEPMYSIWEIYKLTWRLWCRDTNYKGLEGILNSNKPVNELVNLYIIWFHPWMGNITSRWYDDQLGCVCCFI